MTHLTPVVTFPTHLGSQLAGLALNVKKKLPRDPPTQQQTVVPPPASGGSSNSGGRSHLQQQQRFGSNPPPDVLNPANSIAMKNHENDSANLTVATSNVGGRGV